MQEQFFNIVGAERRSSEANEHTICPRTGKALWEAPLASSKDLEDAVSAAQTSSKSWAKTDFDLRQNLLRKFASEITAQTTFLSEILSRETGKTKLLGNLEIEHTVNFLKFNASQSLADEIVYEDAAVKIVATHTPLGVVAAICPWNFPLVLAMGKIAAGLLTGNCVIVKPSPLTPYTTLKVVELALNIFPPGVVQVLNGGAELGRDITIHPGINKISFTGSTATGRKIMENAASSLKRVTLELGGNDATIVCDDVDVASVAQQVAQGCLFHSGQMCVATKRVYVHKSIYVEFLAALVKEFEAVTTHTPYDTPSTFGPLQNHMQFSIIRDYIEDCKAQGYKFSSGGKVEEGPGLWIQPTIVDRPPDDSLVVAGEQFGPITPVLEWDTEEEVILRANYTSSGLGACVWAKDTARAESIGRRLEVGSVWLNSFEKPLPMAYFSGHKESGIGGEWGKQGLLSYVNTQSLHMYKELVQERL